jgi:hypothetical protein
VRKSRFTTLLLDVQVSRIAFDCALVELGICMEMCSDMRCTYIYLHAYEWQNEFRPKVLTLGTIRSIVEDERCIYWPFTARGYQLSMGSSATKMVWRLS